MPCWTIASADEELKKYKLVDTDGQAFADAALSEREDNRQIGANNFWLAPHFIKRLAHLGWGFGPSITALGLAMRVRPRQFAGLGASDLLVGCRGLPAREKDSVPGTQHARRFLEPEGPGHPAAPCRSKSSSPTSIRSTWTRPALGRSAGAWKTRWRPASCRLFLDMGASLNGKKYHVELLNDPALWDSAPIEPKTPPNPLKNDKEFLPHFPYLADPW